MTAFCFAGLLTHVAGPSAQNSVHAFQGIDGSIWITGLDAGEHELLLFDALGRVVLQKRARSDGRSMTCLDIGAMAGGVYTLAIPRHFSTPVFLGR